MSYFQAPTLFLLKMTIPLVDYEAENHNWNKFLNIINCLTGPLFTVFAIKGKSVTFETRRKDLIF